MPRLASPVDQLQSHYTVVVVGSGYGGAIAASRFARAGQRVCVLERGKEFQPGEYPDKALAALGEMQAHLPGRHVGPRTGLYDFHVSDDISVFVGCGLGGTSLVNANVSLRPERRVLEDPRWPGAFRRDLDQLLEDGYRRAAEMLKPSPYPDRFPALHKLAALEASATALAGRFYRPPINVNFDVDGPNHVGVKQAPCRLCGDCVSGCNHAAKNTVLMNYLPDAKNHGAEIYTRVAVRRVERAADDWVVHFQLLESGQEKFDAPTQFVRADIVVLAAGALGSTEILLRSRAAGLGLSAQVGRRFTGNGDVLAFGYNTEKEIDGIGFGHHAPAHRTPVGPCITGVIDLSGQPVLDNGMVIEEGSMPGALAPILPAAMIGAAKLAGRDLETGLMRRLQERLREWVSVFSGAYHGAVRRTQTYLVMTHDDAAGEIRLDEHDDVRIRWPGVGDQPVFRRVNERLKEATRPLGGVFVKNPVWSELFHDELISVHPLGGCVMAETAAQGVVNHKGQAFSGSAGDAVYEGLYVCDGAVIPRSLGLNPLLTISAVAERCCALAARDRGWTVDYAVTPASLQPETAVATGIQFTETMRGYFAPAAAGDYRGGAEQGRRAGSSFAFTLTITSGDVAAMLRPGSGHRAAMTGTVQAPALSAQPLTVTAGEFSLFVPDPARVEAKQMRYEMRLTSEAGKAYHVEGFKEIHDDPGTDLWSDTTTLYITARDGPDRAAPVVGQGVLTIAPADFLKQLTTLAVSNAPSIGARLRAVADFGRFFAGTLYDTYGGIVAKPHYFNPGAAPREKRPLRVGAPVLYRFTAADGVPLLLTRYQGGRKGPVILSHGLGVSSLIFAIDTIETNLLEYLYAQGYDVWLLDYRASIALPASNLQSTGDVVATQDYPAAVVRQATGAKTVQMVVHCYGSTTFFIAMLAGLDGVRSVVSSQIATRIEASTATRLKAGVHLSEVLELLRVKTMTAYADAHEDWKGRLIDDALRLTPVAATQRCESPVCHRITFIYSLLYQHEQLNEATHDALHEMFGVANVAALDHLSRLARETKLVRADGADVYMPHLDRLALPITFIHGAENQCFLPVSTQLTYDELSAANGAQWYRRRLIPGYGHIDCIFGKNAARDVYPFMLEHLDATAS